MIYMARERQLAWIYFPLVRNNREALVLPAIDTSSEIANLSESEVVHELSCEACSAAGATINQVYFFSIQSDNPLSEGRRFEIDINRSFQMACRILFRSSYIQDNQTLKAV
jgi:hypothetical protein